MRSSSSSRPWSRRGRRVAVAVLAGPREWRKSDAIPIRYQPFQGPRGPAPPAPPPRKMQPPAHRRRRGRRRPPARRRRRRVVVARAPTSRRALPAGVPESAQEAAPWTRRTRSKEARGDGRPFCAAAPALPARPADADRRAPPPGDDDDDEARRPATTTRTRTRRRRPTTTTTRRAAAGGPGGAPFSPDSSLLSSRGGGAAPSSRPAAGRGRRHRRRAARGRRSPLPPPSPDEVAPATAPAAVQPPSDASSSPHHDVAGHLTFASWPRPGRSAIALPPRRVSTPGVVFARPCLPRSWRPESSAPRVLVDRHDGGLTILLLSTSQANARISADRARFRCYWTVTG